jgi:hypothetical protein
MTHSRRSRCHGIQKAERAPPRVRYGSAQIPRCVDRNRHKFPPHQFVHIKHKFHFDNVRVLLSRLQHDKITVCNRSVALPRPARPKCNNCGFRDGCLLSLEAAQRLLSGRAGWARSQLSAFVCKCPCPPRVLGGTGLVVCVRRCPTFPPVWVVSSALAGLASGFGMGPGVSLSLWPP